MLVIVFLPKYLNLSSLTNFQKHPHANMSNYYIHILLHNLTLGSQQTSRHMEALTAVSVAALTIYDMCKAVQKDMQITNIRLLSKSGGKSGDYTAKE